jgi:methionyl-tRNA formyltransferase
MKLNKIAIVTSGKSWFVPYAEKLVGILKGRGMEAKLFCRHEDIGEEYQTVFILSYFRIIEKKFLERHQHNLVVHESDLPRGRGWAPLFWQVLEGKNKIPIALLEASEGMDEGDIYIKDNIIYEGHELHDELREMQALKTMELCLRFLDEYENMKLVRQEGEASYYDKRTPTDSELDINKSLKEQFNLLRVVDNDEFPASFHHKGYKYVIKIYREDQTRQRPSQ